MLIMYLDRMDTGHHSRWCWIGQSRGLSPSLQSSVSWWKLSRFAQKFHPKKAIWPELKLTSLYLFSPLAPKFSSNYIKQKILFFEKCQAGCNQHWIFWARTKITLVQLPVRNLTSKSEIAQNDVENQVWWGTKKVHFTVAVEVRG